MKKFGIEKVYMEQVSGTPNEGDRPEFTSMVTAILKDGCKTIVGI